MGATAIYKLPWPELPEIADGPDAFQDLAVAAETAIVGTTKTAGSTPYGFAQGAREAAYNIASAKWTYVPLPSTGMQGGTGITGGASYLSVTTPGLYDIQLRTTWAAHAKLSSRRILGVSSSTVNPPGQGLQVSEGSLASTFYQLVRLFVFYPSAAAMVFWVYQESGNTLGITGSNIIARRVEAMPKTVMSASAMSGFGTIFEESLLHDDKTQYPQLILPKGM